MRFTLVMANVIICGIITLMLSFFFASGTIAENYTDQMFVAPEFFFMLLIWLVGALIIWWLFTKIKLENASKTKFFLINLSIWVTIPIGFRVSMTLAL
ncbi:hypothetical protein F9U64_21045 [Gracilibacillus oryzae]|uniref:Uncharacterized protein n=1 Tax=Gracilibacillus oryzae TaxID=1672701 RepID=A0A7C8GQJ7_9BACI|nr:hypothetical protein [Gracilibacillus oryzae]KAB8126019.1 hypothetical protein F9U64_21045 [Gracilibacillus oryzae]